MFSIIKRILFGFALMVSTIGNAQEITEGVFKYGLISYEFIDENVDTSALIPLLENLGKEASITIYFAPNRVALVGENRLVINIDNKKIYEFRTDDDEKFFSINDYKLEVKDIYSSFTESTKRKKLDEHIFGLNCTQYQENENNVTKAIIITEEIVTPEVALFNAMKTDVGFIVSLEQTIPDYDLRIKTGILSFSPQIVDRSILSIDTIGMTNLNNITEKLKREDAENAQSDEESSTRFKYEEELANYRELVEKMIEKGLLPDSKNYDYSRYPPGVPNLLIKFKDWKKGLNTMEQNEIRDRFLACNILTEEVKKICMANESEWSKIKRYNRSIVLALALINDNLNSEKTKRQIIENLSRLNYGDFSEASFSQAYVSGKISLKEFLADLPFFDRLYMGISKSENELFEHINAYFSIAFNRLNLDVTITRKNGIVMLHDGTYTHYLDMGKIKEKTGQNWSPSTKSLEDSIAQNTIVIDNNFYKYLENYVWQISIDNNSSQDFSIFSLEPPFVYGIWDYSEIIKAFPSLEIDEKALYFYKSPSKKVTNNSIGGTFPFNPNFEYGYEISLGNPETNRFFPDYLPTKKKNKFIQYLTENYENFGLDKNTFIPLVKNMETSLIYNEGHQLLGYLPNRYLIVDADVSKDQYLPKFTKDKNDFKDAYPEIHAIVGDSFRAHDFTYDADSHKVRFSYDNQQQIIDPGGESMISFIRKKLRKNSSGKQLYKVLTIPNRSLPTCYYYLTKKEKKEISEIVHLSISAF